MIDYQQIIENLELDGIKNLLESLQIPYKDSDKALIMPTVCHNEDIDEASWKLYYYKDTHLFYCYTECGALSIFKFLKQFYEVRDIQYDWYKDILQVILDCSARPLSQKKKYTPLREEYYLRKNRKELTSYPEGVLECFQKKYPIEWLNDGISPEAMDLYNIKYSIEQNKIIIPHYDANNKLIGIRGRALNPQDIEMFGKYMPVQIEGKWYNHPLSLNLYGLNKNKGNIKTYGIAFICESEKSVLQAENFNFKNCVVASCGSNLNKFQIDLLLRYCSPKEIVICYDNEEKIGEEKYFNKLYKMCKKYSNYCNMSFIYDRKHITSLKDSPTDNGEKIFQKLLKERIKI